ncbi:hypothetical protein ERJ75_001619900 [Trypanosoma vivax]|nr:hypothetical protein ERJ75_001619900 [Trypanosoma vivax]
MRGLSEKGSKPNTQLPQQWEGTVFHAPTADEQQQLRGNSNPSTTNVGFRGIQGLRDELGETSFKPEEKIRTHEGAHEYLTAASPEHLFAACRGMFPMPSKTSFSLKDTWGEMALWPRAVGSMGRADSLNRLAGRVYDRWRLSHSTGARPGVQVEPPGGAPKGLLEEEGPHHQAHPKAQKQQAPVPSNARRRWKQRAPGRYGIGFRHRKKATTL